MDNDCDVYINEEDCAPTDPLMALDEDGDGVCDAICQGDYTVTNQTEIDDISHCIEITGNLKFNTKEPLTRRRESVLIQQM